MSSYTTATGHDSTIVESPTATRSATGAIAGLTGAQLRESVQAVGIPPENVREFLKPLSARGASAIR